MFKTKKSALCSFDDKRFLLADGIPSLSFYRRDIPINIRHVELVGDNAVLLGLEEAETRGVLIGPARDPATSMLRPPANAAPGDKRTTGAASSLTLAAESTGDTSGAWPGPLIWSSSSSSRPPNIWEKRRYHPVETARLLVSQSLWSDDDDGMEGGWGGRGRWDGRRRSALEGRRSNLFIEDECGVSKRGREAE